MRSVLNVITEDPDQLRRFPTEVRLMIFTELLTLWPKTIFRGAYEFGPLDKKEFEEEIGVPWQILLTCRKYHDEAAPILYGNNRFVFCTGVRGEPGAFWRFPISARYMPYLADLAVYFRADDPKAMGSHRVGLFLTSIARRATKLQNLVVLASSDRYYDNRCKWDILFNHHPVCKAVLEMLERKTVRHLKIRMHNDAFLFPTFAHFLEQEFRKYGDTEGRSLTFWASCTCPKGCPYHPLQFCFLCGWDYQMQDTRPIDTIVDPGTVEAGMERMMDMQDELFTLGILPPKDDDEEGEEEEEELEAGIISGTYRRPFKDTYEDNLPAFTSGMLLPGQVRRYRSLPKAPEVWRFRQTTLFEYFHVVHYSHYLQMTFRPNQLFMES
ncbi:hypothetical protein BCR34DRAFT_494944 [Clohesyomyces aquaticus]|uniref:F-box domain-containing protein n=1 Tax=Clohesyomyces aquaticus TaxID=1231657 RepID=A0A1Y1YPT1_9PLEO|nr:hypothetical protein BCR34DRAFT_494944 [Clohesyomyces aquaticus]